MVKIHPDYDYSKVAYQHNTQAITIVCPQHGTFRLLVKQVLRAKVPCLDCRLQRQRSPQKTTEAFVSEAKLIHNNGLYTYSETVYQGSNLSCRVTCLKHGPFDIVANHHLQGGGCQKCQQETKATPVKETTSKHVEDSAQQSGCVVISNLRTVIFMCQCGKQDQKSKSKFVLHPHCKTCGYKLRSSKRTGEHYYRKKVETDGLQFVAFDHERKVLTMKCTCGTPIETKANHYARFNKACADCRKKANNKYDIPYLKAEFARRGCELLHDIYIGTNQPMKYRCKCGNLAYMNWNNFKSGKLCRLCGRMRSAEGKRLLLEEVARRFEKNGCLLLETEYPGHNMPLQYKCSCGCTSTVSTLGNFEAGARCADCREERRKQTCLLRWGAEHYSQSVHFPWNNAYKMYDYTSKFGKTFLNLQGYERFYIDELDMETHDNLVSGRRDVPTFEYEFEGKLRLYFPDFYDPLTHTVVEVKSTWTFKKKKQQCLIKREAVIAEGYNYLFKIYNDKKQDVTDIALLQLSTLVEQ